jgi:hypothetical protein
VGIGIKAEAFDIGILKFDISIRYWIIRVQDWIHGIGILFHSFSFRCRTNWMHDRS